MTKKNIILISLYFLLLPAISLLSGAPHMNSSQKPDSITAGQSQHGLIGFWKLDEGKGTRFYDSSGNESGGSLKGCPEWTAGIKGNAIKCIPEDGYDFAELENTPLLDKVQEGDYTLCAWFKPLSVPRLKGVKQASFGIIMKEGYHIGLIYDEDKRFTMYHFLDGGIWAGARTSITFEPGEFYHITGVVQRSRGISRIFVNGFLLGKNTFEKGAKVQPLGTNPWRFGVGAPDNPDYPFPAHGIIDEVRIYNTALGDAEIASLAGSDSPEAADLTVTFTGSGKPFVNHSYGTLDSLSNNNPPDKYIVPLKPSMVRSTNIDLYKRAKKLKSQFIYFMLIAYANRYFKGGTYDTGVGDGTWPGDNGNWNNWETYVNDTVKAALKKGYADVIWDIWNEPDIPDFWKRDFDRYLETYRRAVLIIRKIKPDALITGPSYSSYSRKKMISFIDFCRKHKVLPDILNWHELNPDKMETIPERVAEVRKYLSENNIPLKRIMIAEIITSEYQHSPGHAVGYIAKIHRAGVEASAKSCWNEPGPGRISNCGINSLDGLLDPVHFKPRSVWWVFKEYADMRGREITVVPENRLMTVEGIAAYDSKSRETRILLGRYIRGDGLQRDVKVRIEKIPDTIVKNGKVQVLLKKIPDSGTRNLLALKDITKTVSTVNQGQAMLLIPRMGDEDACLIILSKPD
ncbi:MAG: hypothetical protein JW969_15745 [Spirochaetales bacterium]|nr:hypothetical protein [Spirochaetales bacterium]